MHELSISSAILDTAVRHAAGRAVTRVDVRIGRLRQVVPASLSLCFVLVAQDTVCAVKGRISASSYVRHFMKR